MHPTPRCLASLVLAAALGRTPLAADPLTRGLDLDFGRDVASRELKGLATRSDGAIVAGPVLTDLAGPDVGGLLWTLAPSGGDRWLVGTGPDGRIMEVTLSGAGYTVREIARLSEPQVFALKPLPDGSVLAGTSPTGALYLVKDGKPVARVILPVDSIFDLVLLPPTNLSASTQDPRPKTQDQLALVATGNPGRIYRVDLARFARAGINDAKITDTAALAAKGLTLFGEIRDRNVRRLAVLANGKIAAGSAPRGNLYLFPAPGAAADSAAKPAAPVILEENRDAEVTDLLPQPNGDLYAAIVFSPGSRENRINRPGRAAAPVVVPPAPPAPGSPPLPPPAGNPAELPREEVRPAEPTAERFFGRSAVEFFPAGGFVETLLARNNVAFYRLARRGDLLLIAAGEEGELLGWDLVNRLSLTFPGSAAAQLNGLAAVPGSADRYLLLRNNAPGLALLDFAAAGARRLETKRLDLGVPGELGSLRFDALRNLAPDALQIEARTSFGSDEAEGWTEWTALAPRDGAYYAPGLRARYVRLKIAVPETARDFEIDTAALYSQPQDRPPVLTDFHLLPPNLGLNPPPEARPPAVLTLGQLLNPNQPPPTPEAAEAKRKNSFLASQLVPSLGSQVATWTVADADGDELAYTFSIRRLEDTNWMDVAVNVADNYAQFNTAALQDGLYRTRLVAGEQAPRPASQRLRETFETDDLLIDHTPPDILDASARREGGMIIVTVHGRDALSLLEGAEFIFNNGWHDSVQHPVDGILDGREETFALETPASNVTGATAVEIHLNDQSGNTASRRLALP